MKYEIQRTSQFKKDFKLAWKRGCDIERLRNTITALSKGEQLPKEYNDHPLKGEYKGCRECHIEPDLLLVYKITDRIMLLTLYRVGSHSDLF